MLKRNPLILTKLNTALLVVDIQEKIVPVMNESQKFITNTLKLIKGCKVLGLPIFLTEQYPKGLGGTINEIKSELVDITPIQKMSFSCAGSVELMAKLKKSEIKNIILAGIESHVCISQTALDLSVNGFNIVVAADAVSSRRKFDYEIALSRMARNNIDVTLTESILFEMLNVCGTEEFKQISKIVK